MKSSAQGIGYLHDCSPTHGLGSRAKRGGESRVESQRTKTRREDEVHPGRLVLTEEQDGGEKEQQRWWRHAGGSGLHPG